MIIVSAQEAPPAFEVSIVKPNKSADTNGMLQRLPGGRMTVTNMPLRPMITFAYQLAQYQLVGGPGWLATDRFDVVAKMNGNPEAVAPGRGPDVMQLALRTLLADRFKLKVHRETRELDIYALVMVKGETPGPLLKPTKIDCAALAAAQRGQPPPPPRSGAPFCGVQGNGVSIHFGGLPASEIAVALAVPAGRMVVDRTGLTGGWDFDLTFAPEQRGLAPGAAPVSDAPSFFTAIQEQLGLKLESTKGPVDVLVIESVEKPTLD
jgi:uncharacterized protein (TIGR03435 family)